MRICFVGDSMVNGTGDPEYLGWVGRVLRDERKRRAELTGYNLGIRRDTSAQIRARWSAEVTCRLPAEFEGRVVFSFGVNDCVQEVDPARSLANAEAILGEAKACWGFKGGDTDGHCLQNRSSRDAMILEIGTRSATDAGHYSDIDMVAPPDGKPAVYTRKDGTPYTDIKRRARKA